MKNLKNALLVVFFAMNTNYFHIKYIRRAQKYELRYICVLNKVFAFDNVNFLALSLLKKNLRQFVIH